MKKLVYTLVLIFFGSLVVLGNESKNDPPEIFKVSIQNDNLFVCLELNESIIIEKLIIQLNGSRRITVKPISLESCGNKFYLNAKQAWLIKRKGIKSIRYYGEKHIVSNEQNTILHNRLP